MTRTFRFALPLALAAVLAAPVAQAQAQAQALQPVSAGPRPLADALGSFVQHPTHCARFLGSPDQANDGLPRDYAEALNQLLNQSEQAAGDTLTRVRQACTARPAA